MQRECKNCNYCKQIGRQRETIYGYGKKRYWCEYPSVNKMPLNVFGNKARGFIGFGENTLVSPLTTKTHPRWCPLNNPELLQEVEK